MGRLTDSVLNLADTAMGQVYDDVSARLDDVMTRIDREAVSATEACLFFCRSGEEQEEEEHKGHRSDNDDGGGNDFAASSSASDNEAALDRALAFPSSRRQQRQRSNSKSRRKKKVKFKKTKKSQDSHFNKVERYANSKLPLSLPPLALYMPTWPLLCLAAQYSSQVYTSSSSSSSIAEEVVESPSERHRGGSNKPPRAMVIKSVPMDHAHAIVFAIRGTASFMDWATVNLHTAPTSPANFLDDPGNLCHAGFLSAARSMVKPVAARLRKLLEEDPGRAAYSLLMTGHSAGGAIAALLYCHMLATAEGTGSELNALAGCFKRIHCVTFGAPPVSLLPLGKPSGTLGAGGSNNNSNSARRLRKCLFLAFVNEGDPVVRADKAYVKSLLELLTRPALEPELLPGEDDVDDDDVDDEKQGHGGGRRRRGQHDIDTRQGETPPTLPRRRYKQVHWPVPPCTLSNAGRIVVLRTGDPMAVSKGRKTVEERLADGVVAVTCEEEELRGVIWGDPVCHMMSLYAGRIETLAVAAVMGRS